MGGQNSHVPNIPTCMNNEKMSCLSHQNSEKENFKKIIIIIMSWIVSNLWIPKLSLQLATCLLLHFVSGGPHCKNSV